MTVNLTKAFDDVYIRMLRVVHQVSWSDHTKNWDIYGNLPKLSTNIQHRRMKFAGHGYRKSELEASQLMLWQPTHGKKNGTTASNLCRQSS